MPEGVFTRENATVTPYDRVVAYQFDMTNGLRKLSEVPLSVMSDGTEEAQLCQHCVLRGDAPEVVSRRLVAASQGAPSHGSAD